MVDTSLYDSVDGPIADDADEARHEPSAPSTSSANSRERQRYAVALDSWSNAKPPGRSSLLRALRSPFSAVTRRYRTNVARGSNKEAGAVQLARHLRLERAWVQWSRFVDMSRNTSVLVDRAAKHFRQGLAARAFYTWLGCFNWAQHSHRQLLQAVAIGNLSRLSRTWRSWRAKAADVVKARNHLLARSREREITHEHHMQAINAQRMAMLKASNAASEAEGRGRPDSPFGASYADRETALLAHQIEAVSRMDSVTQASMSTSQVRGLEEVEAVVAYCRARVTCHECHAMMRSGELFVCLRRGMPSHLHCFQHVMRTSVLHLEFPMPLADVHAVSNVFEFVRFVHQHHRIHALTRFQRYIRIVHSPLQELQRMNEEEETEAAARLRAKPPAVAPSPDVAAL